MSAAISVPGLPFALTPSDGSSWRVEDAGTTLRVTASPASDIFIDPAGDGQVDAQTMLNAATLLAEAPEGDFQLRARVAVDFRATFDAGVLLLWFDERHWGKLCFELSPDREPMIVSVVTRDVSDDANAVVVDGREVWLRVSRIGRVFAYHASSDGSRWQLIRAFALDRPGAAARVGFEAQSPTGEGCDVTFSDIAFTSQTLGGLRDGS